MVFQTQELRMDLLAWYDRSHRKLPWRDSRDPYAILVSELMLQQTQVKTVVPYYLRFMKLFPTLQALAMAPEEKVLLAWQGLGYYRRARNLQAAARQIVEEFHGEFPNTPTGIRALKGVGAYTSAAVASIAFGLNQACLDGNVIRVLTRILAFEGDVGRQAVLKRLRDTAQELIDPRRPGAFNQAMMELGATVCTPRSPCCLVCPVNRFCASFQTGSDPELLPRKEKRVRPSKIGFRCLFLFSGERFLLCRRPEQGLMAGMWELPAQAEADFKPWQQVVRGRIEEVGPLAVPLVHRFTHLQATYTVTAFRGAGQVVWQEEPKSYADSRWVDLSQLAEIPLTKVLVRLLPQIRAFFKGGALCPSAESALPGLRGTPS